MRTKNYHEAQNERWHEQYLQAEELLFLTENALCQLEHLVLKHISDEAVRADIAKIVDSVFRRWEHDRKD